MTESSIYIIDDNKEICQALKFLFATFCHIAVAVYHDPLLFLEEFSPELKGCLIIDLDMPAMNGLLLIKELKRRNNTMKIMMMSGHGGADVVQQALNTGAHTFITKPFKIDCLLEQVKAMLERPI